VKEDYQFQSLSHVYFGTNLTMHKVRKRDFSLVYFDYRITMEIARDDNVSHPETDCMHFQLYCEHSSIHL